MQRFNKPRVFLSHSRLDKPFIEKLYDDLRKSQIDPWLDSEEIRHGKPWLNAIFEDGIPTCDCVLMYFTENSIDSKMVIKEMDTAILHQLQNSSIAFLPYVDKEIIRQKLRADIQALQIPIWNDSNYAELLPCVVSEIWRSYHERSVLTAIQAEKLKRVQAELELEKVKQVASKTIFDGAEESDFVYILTSIDKNIELIIGENLVKDRNIYGEEKSEQVATHHLLINLKTVVINLLDCNKDEYIFSNIHSYINSKVKEYLAENNILRDNSNNAHVTNLPNILDELLTFGLVESQHIPPSTTSEPAIRIMMKSRSYRYVYTPKMYRFRYWLAYNKLLTTDFVVNAAGVEGDN